MLEKHIVLDDADPAVFYGVNNANMQLLKALFPKLRIVARGNVLRVMGSDDDTARFEDVIRRLEKYCAQFNCLKEDIIVDVVNGQDPGGEKSSDVILFGVTGRPILPRSVNQKKLVTDYATHDMLFAIGPAGSGKRTLARQLKEECGSEPECSEEKKSGYANFPVGYDEKLEAQVCPKAHQTAVNLRAAGTDVTLAQCIIIEKLLPLGEQKAISAI